MNLLRICAALAAFVLLTLPLRAQVASPDGAWTRLESFPAQVAAGEAWIRPRSYSAWRFDQAAAERFLAQAPLEDSGQVLVVHLPMPEGHLERFEVVLSPVMAPELAAAYPSIRSYLGYGVDDPWATVRFDVSPLGFRAQILTPQGAAYVDPYTKGDWTHYVSYRKRDFAGVFARDWRCLTIADAVAGTGSTSPLAGAFDAPAGDGGSTQRAGPTRRTFRLAVSATAEYTAFHGGTVTAGLAAVNTLVNRVTGVYEVELNTRLLLVANNDQVIFTNAATDGFTNGNAGTMLNENQTVTDARIGSANYDVGHVVGTGSGGVAGSIGNVCTAGQKARGVSLGSPPVNDPFVVDYVCHELGHQFAGFHTFHSCGGGQGGPANRAVEPGSGSTIMAYAGICGSDNLQPNSDPIFHSLNFDDMIAYIAARPCRVDVSTTNLAPVVAAGADFVIPRNTPFALTATGSDPNGDAITFAWEQIDTSSASDPLPVDPTRTVGPITRPFNPTTSPTRNFPPLSVLLGGPAVPGEVLPAAARTMNFRVTARDNRGGVNTDDMVVTVAATGPFRVLSPNTSASQQGRITVTWDVAGTNAAPVNAANVRILLSTDGGNTYPTVLAASTPNDGSESILLPSISSTTARVRIEAVGNIFFDISDANFTILPFPPGVGFSSGGAVTVVDVAGNGNANGAADPGETSLALTVPVLNEGGSSATGVSATLTSSTPTASVVSGVSSYPNLASFTSGVNATPFVIAIAPEHPCGQAVNLSLTVSSAQGSSTFGFSVVTGRGSGGSTPPTSFAYAGSVVVIPDTPTDEVPGATLTSTVNVSGAIGTITDVNVRFLGTTCSSSAGSTTVGLDHTFIGDLEVVLVAPDGTRVLLIDRLGSTRGGCGGNNFCQLTLDDGATALLSSVTDSFTGPLTGNYKPQAALSVLNGRVPNGTWRMEIRDFRRAGIGSLRRWEIVLSSADPRVCDLPRNLCPADWDGNGEVEPTDISAFFVDYRAGEADFDGNGETEPADIPAFFGAYRAGC